jgi:hypothetical protein
MRVSNLYCIHCGNKSAVDIMPEGEPVPCRSCGEQPVDTPTLMLASGVLDVTMKLCGECHKSAPLNNKFCYHCGNEFN